MVQLPQIHPSIINLLNVIVGILVFFTILFNVWKLFSKKKFLNVMLARTYSWWAIFVLYVIFFLLDERLAFVGLGVLSLFAFKELISSLQLSSDYKRTYFWAYLAIPVQYYLAYIGNIKLFMFFIPVMMFLVLPMRSILSGHTKDIVQNFSALHWGLMLTVFSLSHVAYILSLPPIVGFDVGQSGIILYFLFLCQFNDVLQFLWGTLLGRHPISPKVSPGKTWEGFLGGLATTMFLAYHFRYLTPLSGAQSIVSGFIIATTGFFGDLTVSAIKRSLGIKDMGNTIPGHGGIMDRLDSLSFAALAFFYTLLFWVYP